MARRPATPANKLHDIRREALKKRDYMVRTKHPSAERLHVLFIDTLRLLAETLEVVSEIEKRETSSKPQKLPGEGPRVMLGFTGDSGGD